MTKRKYTQNLAAKLQYSAVGEDTPVPDRRAMYHFSSEPTKLEHIAGKQQAALSSVTTYKHTLL